MTLRRQSVITAAVLGVFMLGHMVVRITGLEWWPFSTYPMYAPVFEPIEIGMFEVWATSLDGGEAPLPIWPNLRPFAYRQLDEAFQRHRLPEERLKVLKALRRWYNQRAGEEHREPITGLRLYLMIYSLEGLKSLADDPKALVAARSNPTRRLLLAESKDDQ